ncbi:600ae2ea-6ac0-4887-8d90-6a2283057779 [Thermothielavioides terrestris]|jgi:hypothetical protein|uniref:600ae2ea-6ac0-4887-8d90-6a2283057779 n=1 Tax=Thermothielavioides terrestris TaxID=2587410 RepID=A0A3S4CC81_9PEZI|nr:600ae2ea-6ac0-4887-8d90-6a2283057779 [Thermothielavioides terrestris]
MHVFFHHDGDLADARNANVIGAFLAVLPPEKAAAEANRWILVLRTGQQSTMAIELKQTDPVGNTAVCCSPGPRVLDR